MEVEARSRLTIDGIYTVNHSVMPLIQWALLWMSLVFSPTCPSLLLPSLSWYLICMKSLNKMYRINSRLQ